MRLKRVHSRAIVVGLILGVILFSIPFFLVMFMGFPKEPADIMAAAGWLFFKILGLYLAMAALVAGIIYALYTFLRTFGLPTPLFDTLAEHKQLILPLILILSLLPTFIILSQIFPGPGSFEILAKVPGAINEGFVFWDLSRIATTEMDLVWSQAGSRDTAVNKARSGTYVDLVPGTYNKYSFVNYHSDVDSVVIYDGGLGAAFEVNDNNVTVSSNVRVYATACSVSYYDAYHMDLPRGVVVVSFSSTQEGAFRSCDREIARLISSGFSVGVE